MLTIRKYPLRFGFQKSVQVTLPMGAKILTVQSQDGAVMLWAQVETTAITGAFQIDIVGTGQPAEYRPETYIGTVQNGPDVWHLFGWWETEFRLQKID